MWFRAQSGKPLLRRGTVVPGSTGFAPRRDWSTKFEMRSPRYTTRLNELPVIGAAPPRSDKGADKLRDAVPTNIHFVPTNILLRHRCRDERPCVSASTACRAHKNERSSRGEPYLATVPQPT